MTGYRVITAIDLCRNFFYGRIIYITLFFSILLPSASAQTITDSYRVVEWSHKDGLSIPFKNHMLQDTNGFLWITSPLGINRFDGGNFTIFNPENSGNSSYSFTIVEDSLHNLWTGTNKGILYYNTRADTFGNIFPDIGSVCIDIHHHTFQRR